MGVGFDRTGGDDIVDTGDLLGGAADQQAGGDAGHGVRVARLADTDNAAVAHADIGLDDAGDRVDDGGAIDNDVEDAVAGRRIGVDPLAIAQVLAGADDEFMPVDGVVVLDLDQQFDISETDDVALGRAVEPGIGFAGNLAHGVQAPL